MKKSSPLISTAVSLVILFFAAAAAVLPGAGCKPVPPGSPSLQIQLVASGFTHPTALAAPGDGSGRLFITEQTGAVRIVGSSGRLLPAPFLDISDRMVKPLSAYDESGLLGIAFHPDYAVNGRLFIFYNAPPTAADARTASARMSVFPNSWFRPMTRTAQTRPAKRCCLRFPIPRQTITAVSSHSAPTAICISVSAMGARQMMSGMGTPPASATGRIRQICLAKYSGSMFQQAAQPPFRLTTPLQATRRKKRRLYAYGLRNPWRFSFDAVSGRLFCGDVGQNLYEEIDIIVSGGNYGWNIKEGLSCFNKDSASSPLDTCSDTGAGGEPLHRSGDQLRQARQRRNDCGKVRGGRLCVPGRSCPAAAGAVCFRRLVDKL